MLRSIEKLVLMKRALHDSASKLADWLKIWLLQRSDELPVGQGVGAGTGLR